MYEVSCWIHVNMKVFQFVGYIKYLELFGGKLFLRSHLYALRLSGSFFGLKIRKPKIFAVDFAARTNCCWSDLNLKFYFKIFSTLNISAKPEIPVHSGCIIRLFNYLHIHAV